MCTEGQGDTGFVSALSKHPVSKDFAPLNIYSLSAHIKQGAIGIIGADSFYRIVGSAQSIEVVNRVREIKHHEFNKSLTIFISEIDHMKNFGVNITNELRLGAKTYWPGVYSIVTPTTMKDEFRHLTCEQGNLCFHMPDRIGMFELLDLTGPIVATSAIMKDKENSRTIDEAYEYFGDQVDFYCDASQMVKSENIVIKFINGEVVELFNRMKPLESMGNGEKREEGDSLL